LIVGMSAAVCGAATALVDASTMSSDATLRSLRMAGL
jgi:hypothetical protein